MSLAKPTTDLYVGAISGTSVDGLDLALLETGTQLRVLAATTRPFPEALRVQLLAAGQPGTDDLDALGSLDHELGSFIGLSIREFISACGHTPADIVAIGSHGQTVRHRPARAAPFTWQIGDPNMIAELTGVTTVADFRRRDMAAGGQGAPLVPLFHDALFRSTTENRVVVNIGGIGNITVLPGSATLPVRGFDTGPGNGLMDSWCAKHLSLPFDSGGQWAATGNVLPDLLKRCRADDYFSQSPPKSTGREQFNLAWLDACLSELSATTGDPADVQRTLLELTAGTIIDAIHQWGHGCNRIILCGGGRHNGLLRQRLSDLAEAPVEVSEAQGIDGDSIEAATFAWLAMRRIAGLAGNAPEVTGAVGVRVLGALYAP